MQNVFNYKAIKKNPIILNNKKRFVLNKILKNNYHLIIQIKIFSV